MLTLQIILVFAMSLALSLAAMPLVTKLALAYGLLDRPDGGFDRARHSTSAARRIHRHAVPRLGGVGIALAFLASFVLWPSGFELGWLLGPGLLVFLMGVFDDIKSAPASVKLAIQLIAVGLAVIMGGLQLTQLTLWSDTTLHIPAWLGFILSTFIVVGAINSINMIDGLDGLAGGIVLIGVVLLSYLYFLATREYGLLVCVSLPLIGALLGFLKYNTHPATIFMGDGGSNWLGYMTGILMLMVLTGYQLPVAQGHADLTTGAANLKTSIPLVSVILCAAVPVFDTACVIANRLRQGLHPMRPDKRHFHHTLLQLGLNHSQSVSTVYFVALVAGVLGIVPVAFPNYHLNWIPYFTTASLLILFPLALQTVANTNRPLIGELLDARAQALNFRVRRILHYWETLNRYTIYCILILAPVLAGIPQYSIGVAAGISAGALLLHQGLDRGRAEFLQSVLIAVSVTVLLIANNTDQIYIQFGATKYNIHSIYNGLFVWLAMSSIAFFLGTVRRGYLIVSPSDFLFVIFPLVLILVPEPLRTDLRLHTIGLKLLVLFAALRTMVRRQKYAMRRFGMITVIGLVYVFLAGALGMRFVG